MAIKQGDVAERRCRTHLRKLFGHQAPVEHGVARHQHDGLAAKGALALSPMHSSLSRGLDVVSQDDDVLPVIREIRRQGEDIAHREVVVAEDQDFHDRHPWASRREGRTGGSTTSLVDTPIKRGFSMVLTPAN